LVVNILNYSFDKLINLVQQEMVHVTHQVNVQTKEEQLVETVLLGYKKNPYFYLLSSLFCIQKHFLDLEFAVFFWSLPLDQL